MGDAGEGLIDADDRIQERLHEIAEARMRRQEPIVRDPAHLQKIESLRLARADLERQRAATSHERRRELLGQAIAEIDRQIADASGPATTGH